MIKTVNASPFIPALKGASIALGISLASVFASAFILKDVKQPELLIAVLPKVIQVISALVGGFFAGRFSGSRPYVSGAVCGLIISAVITVGALISSGFRLYYAVVSIITVTAASVIGSLLSREKPKSGNARKKAIMKMMKN